MAYIFVFLCLISSLFANSMVTENDPSTLVEGVSVITGDLYTFEEDLVVPGAEPIHFRRAYLTSVGNIGQYPHLTALWNSTHIQIREPNGTLIFYKQTSTKKEVRYEVDPMFFVATGVSNTASGQISALSNLKNQFLIFGSDGKRFVLHTANGTKRTYRTFQNQEKDDIPWGGKGYLKRYFRLESEELPNGNKIAYKWSKKDALQSMTTVTPKLRPLANANFPTPNSLETIVHASFGKSLTAIYATYSGFAAVRSIASSDLPDQRFTHIREGDKTLLKSVSLPLGRTLHIDYENAKVKTLSSKVGSDDKLIVTHTFHYGDKNSYVLDAQGNKTTYFWNDEYRLTSIQKFIGKEIK